MDTKCCELDRDDMAFAIFVERSTNHGYMDVNQADALVESAYTLADAFRRRLEANQPVEKSLEERQAEWANAEKSDVG